MPVGVLDVLLAFGIQFHKLKGNNIQLSQLLLFWQNNDQHCPFVSLNENIVKIFGVPTQANENSDNVLDIAKASGA